MSFFEKTRKPVGVGGKIMVAMMNSGHGAMADWGLGHITIPEDACILDAGCGGGANIKKLLIKAPKGQAKGIDYSKVSVEKSRKANAKARIAEDCLTYEKLAHTDEKLECKITRCAYAEIFAHYGIRNFAKVFCNADLCMEAMHRHAKFIRHSDLVDGPYCHDEIIKR